MKLYFLCIICQCEHVFFPGKRQWRWFGVEFILCDLWGRTESKGSVTAYGEMLLQGLLHALPYSVDLQCSAVLNCLLLLKHYLDFIVSSIWNPTVEISTDLLVVWGSDFLWVDLQDENRGELHVLWLLQQSTEGLLQAAQSPVSRAHQRTQGNILHHMVKLHVDLWYAQVVATWFCVMNTWADQQTNIK